MNNPGVHNRQEETLTRVYIEGISSSVGQDATIAGWVYSKRSSGKIHFLLVRDGTGIIQCVCSAGDLTDELMEVVDRIPQESSVLVTGVVRADSRAPGGYELLVKDLKVIGWSNDYPITPKEHGIAFLMERRHLWLRSSRPWAILRIRAELVKACRDFFDNKGFLLVDTPIFTPSSCEGTTTLFDTDYFGTKAYLSQSGQLYNEATCIAFGKTYCFGPTFRSEKSKTRRHLTEFWQVEPEMAWAELDEAMEICEEMLVFVVERILENRRQELEILERDIAPLEEIQAPFPRITYDEATQILKNAEMPFEWGDDFGGDEETVISEQFTRPVMVHRYPAQIKPFYMKRDPDNQDIVLNFDAFAPEGYGEIVGGGQREDRLEILEKRLIEYNLPRDANEWYLDLRRYGTVPHSGFGLGIERALAWITKVSHVRETIPFPRLMDRVYP
jgi:asparaginyl-tRNA synthetase